jgi:hypothetical protein
VKRQALFRDQRFGLLVRTLTGRLLPELEARQLAMTINCFAKLDYKPDTEMLRGLLNQVGAQGRAGGAKPLGDADQVTR